MFMCRNNKNCQVKFKFGTTVIKQVQNYTYLGVNINSSGSFNKAQTDLCLKGNKALFKLKRKYHNVMCHVALA